MKLIKEAIKEIDDSLHRLDLFTVLVKTLVLMTLCYLFLFVLALPAMFALMPALIYFVSSMAVRGRIDTLKRVERAYDHLQEKLRTARDYQDKDNMVLQALEEEIVRDLKKVELARFFPYHQSILLIVVLVLAVSSSLYIASKDVRILDFNDVMQTARQRLQTAFTAEPGEQGEFSGTEESIMQVGDEKVVVEINPVGLDLDFSEVSDEADYRFSAAFPKDIFLSSQAAYESEFTEEQQLLIKRYFEKTKTGG